MKNKDLAIACQAALLRLPKATQGYWLLKKQQSTGSFKEVAKIPALVDLDMEEFVQENEVWGGIGYYKATLFDNDDKRIESQETIAFTINPPFDTGAGNNPDPFNQYQHQQTQPDLFSQQQGPPYHPPTTPDFSSYQYNQEEESDPVKELERTTVENISKIQNIKAQKRLMRELEQMDREGETPARNPELERLENLVKQQQQQLEAMKADQGNRRDDMLLAAISNKGNGMGEALGAIITGMQQTSAQSQQAMAELNQRNMEAQQNFFTAMMSLNKKEDPIKDLINSPIALKFAETLLNKKTPTEELMLPMMQNYVEMVTQTQQKMTEKAIENQSNAQSASEFAQKIEAVSSFTKVAFPSVGGLIETIARIKQQTALEKARIENQRPPAPVPTPAPAPAPTQQTQQTAPPPAQPPEDPNYVYLPETAPIDTNQTESLTTPQPAQPQPAPEQSFIEMPGEPEQNFEQPTFEQQKQEVQQQITQLTPEEQEEMIAQLLQEVGRIGPEAYYEKVKKENPEMVECLRIDPQFIAWANDLAEGTSYKRLAELVMEGK